MIKFDFKFNEYIITRLALILVNDFKMSKSDWVAYGGYNRRLIN